jgi:GNAT superfamily N-acetyltransferase
MNNDFLNISELDRNEVNILSNMVNNVFEEFVGKDYSDIGNNTFKDFIEPKNISERLGNNNNKCFVAKYNNEIIGILEIRNKDHISLFFVKKEFHKKGIGKKLFEYYINTLKQENTEINIITVNSSIDLSQN